MLLHFIVLFKSLKLQVFINIFILDEYLMIFRKFKT